MFCQGAISKKWKKTSLASFGCCTADSQTDAGRHQLYNNGSLVLFSTAWSFVNRMVNIQFLHMTRIHRIHRMLEDSNHESGRKRRCFLPRPFSSSWRRRLRRPEGIDWESDLISGPRAGRFREIISFTLIQDFDTIFL